MYSHLADIAATFKCLCDLLSSMVESEIIGAAKAVYDELGPGYTESVYHRSLESELASREVTFTSEGSIPIFYKGNPVGRRRPDLFVDTDDGTIIIELKARGGGEEQLLQYLDLLGKDENFDVCKGVLINFGDDLEIEIESV